MKRTAWTPLRVVVELAYEWLERREHDALVEPLAPCPCGEPSPKGYPPCTFERPCGYGKGHERSRWSRL